MLDPLRQRIKPISDQIEAAGRKLKELMDRSAGKTYLLYGAKLGLTKDQAPDIPDLRSIGFSVIEGSGLPLPCGSGLWVCTLSVHSAGQGQTTASVCLLHQQFSQWYVEAYVGKDKAYQ